MKTATAIKAMVPFAEIKDDSGILWLKFKYSNEDKLPPYRWPKAIKYDGKTFIWMSYNSDYMNINYKEWPEHLLATPTKDPR